MPTLTSQSTDKGGTTMRASILTTVTAGALLGLLAMGCGPDRRVTRHTVTTTAVPPPAPVVQERTVIVPAPVVETETVRRQQKTTTTVETLP
jgi:hypothetical protein